MCQMVSYLPTQIHAKDIRLVCYIMRNPAYCIWRPKMCTFIHNNLMCQMVSCLLRQIQVKDISLCVVMENLCTILSYCLMWRHNNSVPTCLHRFVQISDVLLHNRKSTISIVIMELLPAKAYIVYLSFLII